MFPDPVFVQANVIFLLQAVVKGNPSHSHGINGKHAVETDGITVTFFNWSDNLRSTVKTGQFDDIIFSEVKHNLQQPVLDSDPDSDPDWDPDSDSDSDSDS